MERGEPSICSSCGIKFSKKHIFDEYTTNKKARKLCQVSHSLGERLGPPPKNEHRAFNF